MIGRLATVDFERHGADLATIMPDSVEPDFKHYATVGAVREGIRIVAGMPNCEADGKLNGLWNDLSIQARVEVSNSASKTLKKASTFRWNFRIASTDSCLRPDEP